MKEIELSKGYKALVDDEDFEYLSQFKWYFVSGYAAHKDSIDTNKHITMHGVVLERKLGHPLAKGESPDHKDRNTVNNTRDNLRPATHKQNMSNKSKQSNVTSQFKGVHRAKGQGKWIAMITVSGRNVYLGRFLDEADAAREYDKQALIHFGEFANLNFPKGTVT